MNLDDLPGPVKATIVADAQSEPATDLIHLQAAGGVPDIYGATINKGLVSQRVIFIDGPGDMLDCAAELRPYVKRYSSY